MQVHGFYLDPATGNVSVDVVADRSITDDQAFASQLKTALPDIPVSIVIDHNYSE